METPKVLISSKGKVLYKRWRGESVGTTDGEISRKDIEAGGKVETSMGGKYLVMNPLLRDRIQFMPKGARPIYEYDAGLIAGLLSLQKDFEVLETGTGSGCVTLFFANIVKHVYTFEKEERFYDIAKKNFEGVENITATHANFLEADFKKEVDAVFLDMAEPWNGMKKADKNLKTGHFMVVFTPIIDDVKKVVEAFNEMKYVSVQAIQLDLKSIQVKKYARVEGLFGFPGFVIVARKF